MENQLQAISYWEKKTEQERKAIIEKNKATRAKNKFLAAEKSKHYEKVRYELAYGIKELQAEIETLQAKKEHYQEINKFSALAYKITGKSVYYANHIVDASVPWENSCGVYFLIQDLEIVYIGQSVEIFNRINQHTGKKFNRVAYVACEKQNLNVLESLYIHLFRPKLNGVQTNGQFCAPVPFQNLIRMACLNDNALA